DYIRPLSVAMVADARGDDQSVLVPNHPDIANPPVYPALLAGLMKILPFRWEMGDGRFWRYQPEVLIGVFNQLLFFVVLFLVYRLTVKLFDPGVGRLAVVALAATELMWRFTTSGLSTVFLMLLVVILGTLLVSIESA